MKNTDYRDATRASVILEYARNRQYDKAQNIINTITSSSGKNKAIQALAQGYTEAGLYKNAIEVLKTVKAGDEIEAPINRQRDISLVECAAFISNNKKI
jgi:thioredoxin-like negative regulator of GroEL